MSIKDLSIIKNSKSEKELINLKDRIVQDNKIMKIGVYFSDPDLQKRINIFKEIVELYKCDENIITTQLCRYGQSIIRTKNIEFILVRPCENVRAMRFHKIFYDKCSEELIMKVLKFSAILGDMYKFKNTVEQIQFR